MLTEKYGKPADLSVNDLQNNFGAKFESISARWAFSNLHVELDGATGKTDEGTVAIYSQPAWERKQKALAERAAKIPKL